MAITPAEAIVPQTAWTAILRALGISSRSSSSRFLRDLPLELNAVGTLSGHGFHPLKAQLTLSNH
jgi:hypothetical protein